MNANKLGVVIVMLMMALLLSVTSAGASDVNETVYIDAIVGDDIYRELYRDNNGGDINVGFIAKRDGGSYPQWEDFIYNTYQENPRVAYIKLSAKEVGSWSFRVGVFETPDMSKTSNRLYTIQVHLNIKAAGNGNNGNAGNAGNPGTPTSNGHVSYDAIVDGKTSDRVHLRETASVKGNSLGLYFTGTPVVGASNPNAEWVMVTIGRQTGYMKSEYLYSGTNAASVTSKQPIGTVNNRGSSWINLRDEPSLRAAVAGKYDNGTTVTILGETVTHWYYVKVGNQYGYKLAEHVQMGGTASTNKPSVPSQPSQGYEMALYTSAPNNYSKISIQYPKFNGAGADTLNATILSRVRNMAQIDTSVYPADTSIGIEYTAAVTLHNRKVVSVVFWGTSYVQDSMHPYTDLHVLNIDLSTMQELRLTDLYTINMDFEGAFFTYAFFPTNPVTSYDATKFPEMLQDQTREYQGAFLYPENLTFFLKPDGIVLSMPAVHATGSDHFEAQLRYGDIQQFYRLSQKYWEN